MSPFTRQRSYSVAALGERKLITEISRWLGSASPKSPRGIGDDCAVLSGTPRDQLITVDPVIYGEHFDDKIPARGVGAKLFNRNLSDIAAMGGRPRAAVIAIATSQQLKTAWLRDFYRGIANLARRHNVPILGGDVAHQEAGFVATMTMLGEAKKKRIVSRRDAKAGDWVFTTGRLGGSRLGWHWKFTPRLAEGQWLGKRSEVHAMMDISDGLAQDLLALKPKGTRIALSTQAIPVSKSARSYSETSGESPLFHALTDGEDYELVFAVSGRTKPKDFIAEWKRDFKTPLTCIGRFVKSRAVSPYEDELDLKQFHGFQHLR
jgi:thiamine-monophosphate kinase